MAFLAARQKNRDDAGGVMGFWGYGPLESDQALDFIMSETNTSLSAMIDEAQAAITAEQLNGTTSLDPFQVIELQAIAELVLWSRGRGKHSPRKRLGACSARSRPSRGSRSLSFARR
jgi:hypothetical protein